jgi:hypothetical protein
VSVANRFRDDGARLSEFADSLLVECPRCGGRALVRRTDAAKDAEVAHRVTLSCGACGHSAVQLTNHAAFGATEDAYFGLPLWLKVPCCGETLWAYNGAHLDYLERYVGARLREHAQHPEHGWSNASVASRLPAWMKSAKNRDAILSCIARLREDRLGEAGG